MRPATAVRLARTTAGSVLVLGILAGQHLTHGRLPVGAVLLGGALSFGLTRQVRPRSGGDRPSRTDGPPRRDLPRPSRALWYLAGAAVALAVVAVVLVVTEH